MVVHKHSIGPVPVQPMDDGLERILGEGMVIADHGAADNGFIPHIMLINFCHGEVEFAMKAGNQRFNAATFFFERFAAGKLEVQGKNSNTHRGI